MFKKPFKVQSKTPLSRKDKQKLQKLILETFPILANHEDILPLLLPKSSTKTNSNEIYLTKISGTNTLIYSQDKEPLFFDVDGKKKIWPTIFALWKAPFLLEPVPIKEPVFEFLQKGAGTQSICASHILIHLLQILCYPAVPLSQSISTLPKETPDVSQYRNQTRDLSRSAPWK